MLPQLVKRALLQLRYSILAAIQGPIAYMDVLHSVNAFIMSVPVHAAAHRLLLTLYLQ